MNFLARDRAMLNTFGHDIEFARTERHRAIPQFDVQAAFQDEKEIVGVVVLVPGELSFTFTTITSQSLKVVIVRGDQKSPKVASLSASDMPSAMCHPLLFREARSGVELLTRQDFWPANRPILPGDAVFDPASPQNPAICSKTARKRWM